MTDSTGPHGRAETGADTQATEVALESADAAARSGSTEAGVPDDEISRAAAAVGADRDETVRGTGTHEDAPRTTEPDTGREVTDTGDTDRWH
jgi:hypothetical protein